MKIMLEQADCPEPEVIVRGNLADPKITALVAALNQRSGLSKLSLYQDETEYLYEAAEVLYFEAQNNKVYAQAGTRRLECRYKLYELAQLLYSSGFIQISKGVVVNVNQVRSVEAEFSGNYRALLKDGSTRLTISRKYMKEFRTYVMEVK